MADKSAINSTTSAPLPSKILFIQQSVDSKMRLVLNPGWSSIHPNYRHDIREFLASKFSVHFSREQLALLADLNWIPQASRGYFSISHCKSVGGFSYSEKPHGFDVEETRRISVDVLKRICTSDELQEVGDHPEYLWVAKEAGLKAFSSTWKTAENPLLVSDLVCTEWSSHYENQIFGFRLKSSKTLDFSLNQGFIFSHEDCLYSLYFC